MVRRCIAPVRDSPRRFAELWTGHPVQGRQGGTVRGWVRDHGLLLANVGLFAIFFVGMVLAGVQAYNGDQATHHEATVSLWGYLHTGDFVEATFENWESEFLQ